MAEIIYKKTVGIPLVAKIIWKMARDTIGGKDYLEKTVGISLVAEII